MLEEPVRNSPRILVSQFLVAAFVAVVVALTMADNGTAAIGIGAAVGVLLAIYMVIAWRRTTLRATDTELIREYNFLFKTRRVVPYNKIASVNVIRTIFDRLLGTATLQVNINSAVNSNEPEISFTFMKDVADQVRNEMSFRMYGNAHDAQREEIYESIIPFTPKDSILHGLFGTSTWALLGSILSVAFAFGMDYVTGGRLTDVMMSLLILAVMFLIPLFSMVIKYYNFKVYRIKDTVYLSHGALRLYRTSFKINRINAVRVKRTLIARLLGKASLEMEVVGLASADEDSRPVLCIMTDMDNIRKVIREVAPMFEFEEGALQPVESRMVWMMKAVYVTAGFAILALAFLNWYPVEFNELFAHETYIRMAVIGTAVVAILSFLGAYRGYKVDLLGMGEDVFMFRYGIVDRCTSVMQYDRVQFSELYAWPMAARRGLARCQVRMLSSRGSSVTTSGYYPVEELERIQSEVMERIRDGRYDYRKITL